MFDNCIPRQQLGSSSVTRPFLSLLAFRGRMTLVSSAFYTEVLANIALGLAVFWLCPWYTAICHRTVTKPLMLLYECKVLLVSSICFFPTDEWTLVLDYCKSEPEFFLCVILCVYLLLYAVLHLTVAQILYTIISYLYLLLKFLLTCFNWFNTAFGSCGYFNLPIVRSQRQLILKHTLACTCIALFLGSLLCPRSTVGSTECGHSGLNCTPRRAPAFSVHSGASWVAARVV